MYCRNCGRDVRFANNTNYQPTTQALSEIVKGWAEVKGNISDFVRSRSPYDKDHYLDILDQDMDWLIKKAQKAKAEIRKIW